MSNGRSLNSSSLRCLNTELSENKEGISFVAQSGGLAGAMGWWTPSQKLPISKVIHLGKGYHINEADILEFFLNDKTTKVISLFLR